VDVRGGEEFEGIVQMHPRLRLVPADEPAKAGP
jgi:hypothetical protein